MAKKKDSVADEPKVEEVKKEVKRLNFDELVEKSGEPDFVVYGILNFAKKDVMSFKEFEKFRDEYNGRKAEVN